MKQLHVGRISGRIPDLFEPDVILPAQFAVVRGMPARGERTLLLAVLEMALRDLELYAGKKARWLEPPSHFGAVSAGARTRYAHARRDRDTLIAWFRSDSTVDVFTFVSICEVFGLHPDAIRRQLAKRGWVPNRSPTHLHATVQHPRQLHGAYRGGQG